MRRIQFAVPALAILASVATARAQDPETAAVMATVQRVFDAMRTAGDVWNERIFDPQVRIDGDLAQVWAYYTFHRNKEFTHCGVDAFMLRKLGAQWKITQLSDSRRTTNCTHTEPPG